MGFGFQEIGVRVPGNWGSGSRKLRIEFREISRKLGVEFREISEIFFVLKMFFEGVGEKKVPRNFFDIFVSKLIETKISN